MGSVVSRAAEKKKNFPPLPDIPDELIKTEILTRLPVKSIVRCRCVCKSWKHLLSGDPAFVESHLTNYSMNPNNAALVFRCSPEGWLRPSKSQPLKSRSLQLAGSVNGLVCIYHHDIDIASITCLGIWNPATDHYKDIPLPPSRTTHIEDLMDFSFGFCFDPVANDYKIVFITMFPDCPLSAQVYSCNAGSWHAKSVKSTFLSRGIHYPRSTIVRGHPYWYNKDVECCEHYYVMSFDVRDEIFRLLPGIESFDWTKQRRFMVNLRDSLAFMFYNHLTTSRLVDVYIYEESCCLWTKNFTVGPIFMPRTMLLRGCFRNGDLFFHSHHDLKLVSVNPETNAINEPVMDYVYNSSRWDLYVSYSFDYVESVVTVKGMSVLDVRKVGNDILIIDKSL